MQTFLKPTPSFPSPMTAEYSGSSQAGQPPFRLLPRHPVACGFGRRRPSAPAWLAWLNHPEPVTGAGRTGGAYWLLRAAEQGHVEAQLALGQSYAFGSGVLGDVEQAAHWLEEAAKTEPEKASRHLALIYARGLGGPADPVRAFAWWSVHRLLTGKSEALEGLAKAQEGMGTAELREAQALARELADRYVTRAPELGAEEAEAETRRVLERRQQRRHLEQERKAIFARALEEYIGSIQASVAEHWRRPTGVPAGLACTVNVLQDDNGKVLRVEIIESSGNVAFDRSVEQAVRAASPLPRPRRRAVFDREIVFLFKPRG